MSLEGQRALNAKRMRSWRKERRRLRLCCQCSNPIWRPESVHCRNHASRASKRAASLRDERKQQGLPSRASIYRQSLRTQTLTAYGGRCACCGIHNLRFLTLDHIGGFRTHPLRRYGRSGIPLYRVLRRLKWPGSLQVLCYNCNCAQAFFGQCPHKTE